MLVFGHMTMPVFASSAGGDIELSYPLAGALIGGAGTLAMLIGMSRTKHRATHADHSIDLQRSRITYRDDTHIRTDRRQREKK